MFAPLAALAFVPQTPLPRCVVAEFRDLKGGAYGFVAAREIAGRLSDEKAYEVVSGETVREAAKTLGLTPAPEKLVDLSRLGVEALGSVDSYVRGGAVVAGEVVDYRIEKARGGRRACLALRVVVYDVASALPVGGALEIGASPIRTASVSDEDLVAEALQDAARSVVRTMRSLETPTATVIETRTRTAIIDRGTRAGFGAGDLVVWSRGPITIGTAHIGRVEPDRAELVFERITASIAPGDRVRRVFVPPPLPGKGESILGPEER